MSDVEVDDVRDEGADVQLCGGVSEGCHAEDEDDRASELSSSDGADIEKEPRLDRGESVNDRGLSLASVIGDVQEGEGEGEFIIVGEDDRMAWTDDGPDDEPGSSRGPNVASMMSEAWLRVSRH
jgi:hypothetical protein